MHKSTDPRAAHTEEEEKEEEEAEEEEVQTVA